MIAKIQVCSNEAVSSMTMNRSEAVDSLKIAHEAGQAITQITEAIADIKALRIGKRLDGLSIRDLVNEGRR